MRLHIIASILEVVGYIAAILIGVSLGLIGGGGSILTVPVLVYLFGIEANTAIPYSLFVVGITSIAGALSYFRKDLVDLRTAIIFGMPSIAMVYLTRSFILPIIPEIVWDAATWKLTKNMLLMLLFAIVMLMASYSMIRKRSNSDVPEVQQPIGYFTVMLQGALVGMLTGLIGAGGGFLIIPALVNLLRLPMKKAIGTSLVIIAVNSLSGFVFSLSYTAIRWPFILSVAAIAIVGILVGSYLSSFIDGKKLKPAFGYFVLVMGIIILVKELVLK